MLTFAFNDNLQEQKITVKPDEKLHHVYDFPFQNLHIGYRYKTSHKNGFDDWQWLYYQTDDEGNIIKAYTPKDTWYFDKIDSLARLKGIRGEKIYQDFVKVYDYIQSPSALRHPKYGYFIPDEKIINYIKANCELLYSGENFHPALKYEAFILYVMIYFGMISEENYIHQHNNRHTDLGASIKLYGLYLLLIRQESPDMAANCQRGVNNQVVSLGCKNIGIQWRPKKWGKSAGFEENIPETNDK